MSTKIGEVNETVIGIQSFEEHVNDNLRTLKRDIKNHSKTVGAHVDDTISTLKEDIRENITDIRMDITNIWDDVSSLRQDAIRNFTSLERSILAINNTLYCKMILLTTGAYVLKLLE